MVVDEVSNEIIIFLLAKTFEDNRLMVDSF